MTDTELRPSYRTLNEPTRLIGLSLGSWAALIVAGGLAYGFLAVSPLPWRLNFSLIAIVLGAPVALLMVREAGTIGPGRLLREVFRWRLHASQFEQGTTDDGATFLAESPLPSAQEKPAGGLPWAEAAR